MAGMGLGTVQFGLDYGVSNRLGRTPEIEVGRILEYAVENGMEVLDTAPGYGDCEAILGRVLPPSHRLRIVTKTPCLGKASVSRRDQQSLKQSCYRSLEKLRQSELYALLVHHADDLLLPGGELLLEALRQLKQDGCINKVGVSVYTGEQIDAVLGLFTPDLVQVPVNILNQRLIQSGHLKRLKEAGVEIHARSVFLQGLLLMDIDDLGDFFKPIRHHLAGLHDDLARHGISRLAAALDFALGCQWIDIVLVGVAALTELVEICQAVTTRPRQPLDYSRWAHNDRRFLDPAAWPMDATPTRSQEQQ